MANTPKLKAARIGLKGRVKVDVINPVRGNRYGVFKQNLILDQGLDQIAESFICDIFAVCAKGVGIAGVTTDTTENVDNANTYTMPNGDNTITRAAGTRDFTADDVGRLVKFDGTGFETTIQSFTNATHVEAAPAPDHNETTQNIHLYFVEQVGLEGELGRTDDYSGSASENGTTTATATKTHKRTFIFEGENTVVVTPTFDNLYSRSGTTVTKDAGSRPFVIGDIGSTIRFRDTGQESEISAFTNGTTVTVVDSGTVSSQNIDLLTPDLMREIPSFTNTYSRTGNTVARDAGTRDFTLADVGKVIYFTNDAVESKITAFTNATHVDVADSGAVGTQNIALYEYNAYSEIGLSHSLETDDNLNIRVKLASPVLVNGATPLSPSDQLKVTYEMDVTVSPSTEQTGSLSSVISDPSNAMSGNKNGKYGIESFAVSKVSVSGETDSGFAGLEPADPGYLALSLDDTAIAPLADTVRDEGTEFTQFEANDYTPGSFTRTYTATFGLNEAISTAWRALMLYNPETNNALFTFVFNNNQKKDADHTLSITITKTWGRSL